MLQAKLDPEPRRNTESKPELLGATAGRAKPSPLHHLESESENPSPSTTPPYSSIFISLLQPIESLEQIHLKRCRPRCLAPKYGTSLRVPPIHFRNSLCTALTVAQTCRDRRYPSHIARVSCSPSTFVDPGTVGVGPCIYTCQNQLNQVACPARTWWPSSRRSSPPMATNGPIITFCSTLAISSSSTAEKTPMVDVESFHARLDHYHHHDGSRHGP
ncbi:hypothetical protein BC826DRAFT_195029 [Russula brevipes]|nr:hypothetical protein BC826DRAFT_195029 [Russula brevipes]